MPLQKQTLSVPVNAALDTKADPFLAEGPSIAENVRFFKVGALVKRNGFAPLVSTTTDPDPLSLGAKRIISDNNQLFAVGGAGVNQVQAWQDGWISYDPPEPAANIVPGQIEAIDYFAGNNVTRSNWVDYYNGKYVVTVNEELPLNSIPEAYATNYVYDGDTVITQRASLDNYGFVSGDSLTRMKSAIIANGVFGDVLVTAAIATIGGNLRLALSAYDIGLTQKLYSNTVTITGFAGEVALCPEVGRTSVYVSVRTGTNTLRVFRIGGDGTGSIVLLNSSTITTATAMLGALDAVQAGQGISILAASSTGTPVLVEVNTVSLALIDELAPTEANFGLDPVGNFQAGAVWRNNQGLAIVAWSIQTSVGLVQTAVCRLEPDLNLTTRLGSDYGVSINGKGFTDASKTILPVIALYAIPNTFTSETHPMAIMQILGSLSNKNNVSYIGNAFFDRVVLAPRGCISNFTLVSGQKFAFLAAEATQTVIDPGIFPSTADIKFATKAVLTTFDYNNTNLQPGSELVIGDTTVLMNSNPSSIDSSRIAPITYFVEPLCSEVVSGADGRLPAGTYQISVHFETSDEKGNIVRSAESDVITVTTTGSTSSIALSTRTNYLVTNSLVCIYMTQPNGAARQLLEKISFNPALGFVTYTITIPPFAEAPFVYTNGGVLESNTCGPSLHASLFNDRIFSVPSDEFNKVYYSNKYIQGEIPGFNNNLFIQVANSSPRYRDKITASQGIGDKLIIFRENSIYWVAGDGANLLGQQSTFSNPEILSQDIGCTNPRSVILTPVGIMFKSFKGIYLIDPGLSLSYVGAAVEQYNGEEIIESRLIADRNIIIMVTASRVLCYDYLIQRWSVDTIPNLVSIAIWKNRIAALKSNGRLGYESAAYVDNFGTGSANIPMKLVTGWIKLTGIQDFGRIYRLLILGRYYSAHTLTVKVYYDYNDAYVETFTITPDPAQGTYQFKIHLAKQKCESIKVEVFDTGSGQSLDLTGMTLEVGTKLGSFKGNTNKQY